MRADLLYPYQALADGRGVQHIVNGARETVPPFATLCDRHIARAPILLATRLAGDDVAVCRACWWSYRATVMAPGSRLG